MDLSDYDTLRKLALALTVVMTGLLAAGASTAYLLVCVDGAVDVPCTSYNSLLPLSCCDR